MDDTTAETPENTAAKNDVPTADAAHVVPAPRCEVTAPIVVDLGRRRARQIKKLREGRGPLIGEINQVIAEVRATLAADLDGKTIVPLVVVYKQKKRKRLGPGPNAPPP